MNRLLILLGDQLFDPALLPPAGDTVIYMAEDYHLCTNVRHHQQKIVLFLASMRAYADELRASGYDVHYRTLDDKGETAYEADLAMFIDDHEVRRLACFEIEDRPAEAMVAALADSRGLELDVLPSPAFTCSRDQFEDYASRRKRLHMADFYKEQRRRLGILMDDGGPEGGQWSFDADNRKKLPKNIEPPQIAGAGENPHVADVLALVRSHFSDHPGDAREFWWPTTRESARTWLRQFVEERLELFGPYEDALTTRSATVFHSVLSPLINLGLLTPDEVISAVVASKDRALLQSIEGFVRQVIGWREFIRGVYRLHGEHQAQSNYWQHERELADCWYDGTTGLPPLDDTIRTAQSLGWTHHIPRLMVAGNLMTLCEIQPQSAHRWFMEMYVDSAEWVMGPNVYGMGIFSDGGIFATKPYICGSNYILKMSDYRKGDWCDTMDGLYWRFIDKHREFFQGNPRLALMTRALDRLDPERRTRIFGAAEDFIERVTR